MAGDERARFCGHCSKHVANLSAMTRAQIETLVREKEGKFCGRFHRRTDGTMLTADCPSRLRRVRERVAKIGGALCALVLSVVGCSSRRGSETTGQVLMGDVAVSPVVCSTNNPPEIAGKIALPAPRQNTNSRVLMGGGIRAENQSAFRIRAVRRSVFSSPRSAAGSIFGGTRPTGTTL